MNDQRIAIITDSGTDVPADFCAEHDVRVIPLVINFSDASFQSGVDIDPAELLRRMEREIPKTSLPSPARIREEFERARADGYEAAVFVTLSSGLSATNQTAKIVADEMDFPVIVGDSLSIGVAAGLVVMETARLVEAGVPFEELRGRIEELARRTRVFFAVRDLKWLRAGGRITDAIYALGRVLNIKPVLMCDPDDGHYVMARKCRGWERALDTEVKLVAEHAKQFDRVQLAVCCSDEENLFDLLESKLRAKVSPLARVERIYHSDVSPDLLVHTGPSLVGLGVMGC
jgi:DegV family protein with EDD domain